MSDQATIARAPRSKEHPYVMIARETLQDKGIESRQRYIRFNTLTEKRLKNG
jgi:hypothetical protein